MNITVNELWIKYNQTWDELTGFRVKRIRNPKEETTAKNDSAASGGGDGAGDDGGIKNDESGGIGSEEEAVNAEDNDDAYDVSGDTVDD